MTRLLASNRKSVTTLMTVGLALSLILGMALVTGCQSGSVSAQEIAAGSPEVQEALGGEVRIVATEIADGKAVVICTDTEGSSYVAVEIDLADEDVIRIRYPAVGDPYLPDPEMESDVLETITDKLSYSPGEEVTIEVVNISDETMSGGGVYFAVYDLSGNLLAGNGLFLAFEWAPGEGFSSFTWDQTNDKGQQVDPGTYVVLGKAGDYTDGRLISIA